MFKIQAVFSDLACGLRIEEKCGRKKGGYDRSCILEEGEVTHCN
jgi:hypothetical protein